LLRRGVYLVGAGPGDADLISLRGLRCIRAADCIVYDGLIDVGVLDHARGDAELIFVGESARHASKGQHEINAMLVELSRKHDLVVRLKGGDPFVFGRGGEEALALAAAGVPFEIVPGVTAAVAAAVFAGIPLTHRDLSSTATFVTGHRTADAVAVDWPKVARSAETIAVYMGVAQLESIIAGLLDGGAARTSPSRLSKTPRKPISGLSRARSARSRSASGSKTAALPPYCSSGGSSGFPGG